MIYSSNEWDTLKEVYVGIVDSLNNPDHDKDLHCINYADREEMLGVIPGSTLKLSDALDDFLDLGTYPMFLASATTFSLSVALSIKTSLEIILALYDVIYVLYAKTSKIDDKLDPSKS